MEQFKRDNPTVQAFHLYGNHRLNEPLFEITFHLARQKPLAPLHEQTASIEGRTIIRAARLIKFEGKLESMDEMVARILIGTHENGYLYRDIAVLCRRHSSIDWLQRTLARYAIPLSISGDFRGIGLREVGDALTLSTIHASQRRQWRYVLILDASNDILPGPLGTGNSDILAEEQRLFYVAATRASEHLDIAFNVQGEDAGRHGSHNLFHTCCST